MATYARVPGTTPLSNLVTLQEAQHDAMRSIERGTTTPPVPVVGQLWIDTTGGVDTLKQYVTGGTWITLMVLDVTNSTLGMAGRKVVNIGAASANGHALQYQQGVLRSGLLADLPAGGFKVTGLGTPSASGDAATKGYVDAASLMVTGRTAVVDDTLPNRKAVVTGLGFQPRMVTAQLIRTATGVESGPPTSVMSIGLGTVSEVATRLFVYVGSPTNAFVGFDTVSSLKIDADGFTYTYVTRGTTPPLGYIQWAAWK